MTTIKRTVRVYFSVTAGTKLEGLGITYINTTLSDLSALGWTLVDVKDIDISIDVAKFAETNRAGLDKTEARLRADFQAALNKLQSTRANLLSLPAPSAPTPQPDAVDTLRATLDPTEAEDCSLTDVFYVTYGFNTEQYNNFSRVYALDYGSARELIFEKIGDKFAFCYTEAEFDGQVKAYGLTEIPLTAPVVRPY